MPAIGPQATLAEDFFTSFDGDQFSYQKWLPSHSPDLVVIGFHGLAGAATDLRPLAQHLQSNRTGTAVYAPNLRGQGNDRITSRKGDIHTSSDWFDDARTFTRLVRRQHPLAPVVWCGESMGALIALHATASASESSPPCDAIILSSPVARLRDDVSPWRRSALRCGAALVPQYKISLESLSGQDEVRVIRDVVHQEQVQTNPYHVSAFTLRLLNFLANMVETMPQQAARLAIPVLLLHGGHDLFSKPEDVADFEHHFASPQRVKRVFFPESYHLLFYDHQRDEVLTEITSWLHTTFPIQYPGTDV